jgi:hypothetical protein
MEARGFQVMHSGGSGDHGIDLSLMHNGISGIAQCKQWKKMKVRISQYYCSDCYCSDCYCIYSVHCYCIVQCVTCDRTPTHTNTHRSCRWANARFVSSTVP